MGVEASGRRVLLYFAWSRPGETDANIVDIDDFERLHLERIGGAENRMDVLARQNIDESAPPHPAMSKLLVCDTTLFSSTAGGVDSLRPLWSNVLCRPSRR